jgi:hypothetical protein
MMLVSVVLQQVWMMLRSAENPPLTVESWSLAMNE